MYLIHADLCALGDRTFFLSLSISKRHERRDDHTVTAAARPDRPARRSVLKERERESRHVFAVPLLSPDTARGHGRRDDGSFNLPSQHNWAACHELGDL